MNNISIGFYSYSLLFLAQKAVMISVIAVAILRRVEPYLGKMVLNRVFAEGYLRLVSAPEISMTERREKDCEDNVV